ALPFAGAPSPSAPSPRAPRPQSSAGRAKRPGGRQILSARGRPSAREVPRPPSHRKAWEEAPKSARSHRPDGPETERRRRYHRPSTPAP
ncbi:unnamed protein product, partial [Effrenium voratum]